MRWRRCCTWIIHVRMAIGSRIAWGGNTNLEAVDFVRELNHVVRTTHQGVVTIAEESTAWPQVSRPTEMGGLGFAMKWNLGWMHDTLDYLSLDPIFLQFHHVN